MSVNERMLYLEKLRRECDDAAPVYAEWIIPEGAEQNKVILYFHGGCNMGNVNSQRETVSNFVNHVGYKTLLFNHRLAPELQASAAINDSVAIYRWMLEQGYHPEDIVFAGDSVGGGIEIGTLIKLRDEGAPLPAACVAFSPSLDPYVSTRFGDLTGFPPIMIQVGNDEVARDDSTCFGEIADSYGVEVHVRVWKGILHCFPLPSPMSDEAAEAMKQVSTFIRNHMQKDNGLAAAFLYMMMFAPCLSAGSR